MPRGTTPRKQAGSLWEISLQENHMLAEDARRLSELLASKRAELRKQADNTTALLAEWGRRDRADYSGAAADLGLSALTPEDALKPRTKVPTEACEKVLRRHARIMSQRQASRKTKKVGGK